MTAELVRGQNLPLPHTRLEIRVSAGTPLLAGATLADDAGRLSGPGRVVHPGAPARPGVTVPARAATEHLVTLDLAALDLETHRITVLLALPGGPGRPGSFGSVTPPPRLSVGGAAGARVAGYTLTGLDAETAVAALEVYRRQGVWKVRAVGQGYAGGLSALLADQGLAPATAADLAAATLAAATAEARPAHLPDAPYDAGTGADTAISAGPGTHAATGGMAASAPAAVPPADRAATPAQTASAPAATTGAAAADIPSGPAAAAEAPTGAALPGPQSPPSAPPGTTISYQHPRRRPAGSGQEPAPPAPPSGPEAPRAGDAAGWTMDERLYNQVWGMFEDLARTTAAYRSAVDFADSRREQELDRALADPRARLGSAGDAARAAAGARYDELTGRARESLDRDLAQLTAEAEVVEPALPPAYAPWDHPAWHAYRPPAEPAMAVRLGDLHLPERPELRIPMLMRLPLERGLWIDGGRGPASGAAAPDGAGLRELAVRTAVLHAVRLLAAHPPGAYKLDAVDPAGTGAAAFAPLTSAGLLAPPPQGAAGVTAVLDRVVRRVELVRMALRGGAADALPADLDPAARLLIVNDFPYGFDDRSVTRLRYLADEGPAVGVHLLLVADREDAAAYGPVLDPLWSSLLRLTPVPDEHLADPWVGHAWTYQPPVVPAGSGVLGGVVAALAASRH
ncbi:TerD family protein [Streptomyces sp. ODS05-4]|uniref:TerD family protein n=1 Tax=Streptomyces sp. ODS05-4 TaxID=2944939 RepID=UPI00210D8AE9|nr:TerD family protein [Streptomyces sp. ODS05-4]